MQKIYKSLFILFISIFISIFIINNINASNYKVFIMNNNNRHTLVLDGTLVIFKNKPISDLSVYDVITMETSEKSIARIMSIDNENKTFNIVYDDFDKEQITIDQSSYGGTLVFHINELGAIYEKYLKQYKNYFLAFPFIILSISFLFFSISKFLLDKEDFEYEYTDCLNNHYDYSNHFLTYFSLTSNNALYDVVKYDSTVNEDFKPNFVLEKKIQPKK